MNNPFSLIIPALGAEKNSQPATNDFEFKIFSEMPKISIKAEPIFIIGDFSITNSLLLSFIVLVFFFLIAKSYHQAVSSRRKTQLYYLVNFFLRTIFSFFSSTLKDRTRVFFPLLGSLFFFIILNNWAGLLPGVGSVLVKISKDGDLHYHHLLRGNNADLNTTLALALISFFIIQFEGIRHVGFKEYLKKFLNFTNPVTFFVGVLEIISELSKVISFSFRLFGNIFAGEVLLTVMAFLVPVLVSFPFLVLEVFVGFVQALVFSMLSAVFISNAIVKHH
ncbi:MAG: F0F1 ATP synthase subunit A [Patescibacteria group bacterium]|nr:F0F1 ATP synthase subunit A [Patescibacteria group bacterium]